MLKVIKTADFRRMPWKNGAGETIEIAVSPDSANWHNFEWRVSMAHVTQSGPFSVFPDVDRTILALSGGSIKLTAGDHKPVLLEPGSEPFSFQGEAETKAVLTGEAVLDFNVMTHRQRYRHMVKRHHLQGQETFDPKNDWLLVLVVTGGLSIEWQDGLTRVGRMEALLSNQQMQVSSVSASELIMVHLHNLQSNPPTTRDTAADG